MSSGSSSTGGGGAAVFGVLFLIGLVITYYWFFIAVGVAVVLFFGIRAVVRHERERRLAAAREAEELAHRADRQHRWAGRGDSRGIYGVEGARLMRSISAKPAMPADGSEDEDAPIAEIAYTAAELDVMLTERPQGWRWAAFVSVLVQRLAEVRPRIRDWQLRYSAVRRERAWNGPDVAWFVTDWMDEQNEVFVQLESFMMAPAFMGVFGEEEATADAEGIVHVANRLMEYYDRFLELAERCRDVAVPSKYKPLLQDCAQLIDVCLDGFHAFIEEFVDVVNEIPEALRHAKSDVYLGPVGLEIIIDDALMERIEKQIEAAAKS